MNIEVVSRRRSLSKLKEENPSYVILDLTSKSTTEHVRFSPFYPHGNIPVPFSESITAQSVEGIWQGLKVFENHDIDESKFDITNMKGIKRTVRKYGQVLGHRKGVKSKQLLSYLEARLQLYLPCYEWVLQKKLNDLVTLIKQDTNKNFIFLDYETNQSIDNLSKPLSHAFLVKHFLENGSLQPLIKSHSNL